MLDAAPTDLALLPLLLDDPAGDGGCGRAGGGGSFAGDPGTREVALPAFCAPLFAGGPEGGLAADFAAGGGGKRDLPRGVPPPFAFAFAFAAGCADALGPAAPRASFAGGGPGRGPLDLVLGCRRGGEAGGALGGARADDARLTPLPPAELALAALPLSALPLPVLLVLELSPSLSLCESLPLLSEPESGGGGAGTASLGGGGGGTVPALSFLGGGPRGGPTLSRGGGGPTLAALFRGGGRTLATLSRTGGGPTLAMLSRGGGGTTLAMLSRGGGGATLAILSRAGGGPTLAMLSRGGGGPTLATLSRGGGRRGGGPAAPALFRGGGGRAGGGPTELVLSRGSGGTGGGTASEPPRGLPRGGGPRGRALPAACFAGGLAPVGSFDGGLAPLGGPRGGGPRGGGPLPPGGGVDLALGGGGGSRCETLFAGGGGKPPGAFAGLRGGRGGIGMLATTLVSRARWHTRPIEAQHQRSNQRPQEASHNRYPRTARPQITEPYTIRTYLVPRHWFASQPPSPLPVLCCLANAVDHHVAVSTPTPGARSATEDQKLSASVRDSLWLSVERARRWLDVGGHGRSIRSPTLRREGAPSVPACCGIWARFCTFTAYYPCFIYVGCRIVRQERHLRRLGRHCNRERPQRCVRCAAPAALPRVFGLCFSMGVLYGILVFRIVLLLSLVSPQAHVPP